MVKRSLKQWISGLTVAGMMFSMLAPMAVADTGVQATAFGAAQVPKLLITELVPDTANISGSDAYEFIEVYNNSDSAVDFKDYNLVYRNAGTNTVWAPYNNGNPGGSMPIPARSSIVIWVMNAANKALTEANFNSNFHTTLHENINLFRVEGGGGMANGGPRDLVIQDKASSTDIVIASYQNDNQTLPDKGIFYELPTNGSINMVMIGSGEDPIPANATPGLVDPGQVTYSERPVITHTPVTQADQKQDLVLQAQITNNEPAETVSASVYYQTGGMPTYDTVGMTANGGNAFQAVIPKAKLTDTQLKYYIQANDGLKTVRSNVYQVGVAMDNTDFTHIPPLLVTEVVPDSTNIGSADGYEFIEIYNNTDQAVNFKDYQVVYRYTDSGPSADVLWPADKEDVIIPSKGTLVFWIINNQNMNATVADFNANYKTNLVEGTNIVRIYSDGMANASNRGLVIATNTGTEVASAYYVAGDAKANMGILYKYPVDGSQTMTKYSAAMAAATPGAVESVQVPTKTVTVTPDTVKPTLTDLTGKTVIDQSKDLEIIGDAKDNVAVKTVALYYKTEKQAQYTKHYLRESFADTMYHYTVFSPELIGNTYLDYYLTASDGTNETVLSSKRVEIQGGSDHAPLRLSVKDGDILSNSKVIRGTGEGLHPDSLTLTMDGTELPAEATYHAVEHNAYFAFDVNGVNYYFKNGITQGEEILSIFQDPISTYTTLSIPFQADRLKAGSNVISIRAGSKASPFDDRPEENKDDFEVKNVRLVFDDGTILYDARYSDPTKVIKMGDSAGKNPFVDFNFDIPASLLASKAYAWNTAQASDGPHTIKLSHASAGTITASVQVDNTAPVIQPTVQEGMMYRGAFTINADVTDALAGVDKVEATLDGGAVTLPIATSSAELPSGSHTFNVKATDKVGNAAEKTIHFTVPAENPDQPQQLLPGQDASKVNRNAWLSVRAKDGMSDEMRVSFYQGFKYDAGTQQQLHGFRGASDTEPPKQVKPDGEQAFGQADYESIRAVDGNYLTDDAYEQFPYQRFEVNLDPAVTSTDRVALSWKGKSLEGRKVTLYAWSPSLGKWNPLQTVFAGTEDFTLQAEVAAGDYADTERKIQVMVQDEVAPVQTSTTAPDYDFSFVWMSDTQYYAKSYPYIYQNIVKWIADHKEDNKIQYVIHTGDIVDNADQEYQWVEADKDMKVLEDAKIPYGVLAGNHDVGHQNNDYSYYSQWFGEDRFKNQPTYGESYDNNRGHYDLVSSNGNDFIIVYMGWGFGDKEIDWINDVLKKYPNRKAILNFHEYMLVSNNRAPMADKVFERVVIPNKNVIAALSGHYHDAELKVDGIDDDGDGKPDRNVYQMLADYQGAPEGGLGYIRLMQFDMTHGKINMKTFSPYLNDYNYYDPTEYPGKDEFTLDLNLEPVLKRVSTDYFGVNVYTANQIGVKEHVASGARASTLWSDLAADTTYQWYAVAEDNYQGKRRSDIWKFTTGTEMKDPGPEPVDVVDDDDDSSGNSSGGGPIGSPGTTISVNGGTASMDGIKITVPSGAIDSAIRITVEKLANPSSLPVETGTKLVGDVYEIKKDQVGSFNKAIQITLPFNTNGLDLKQTKVSLYWFNEETRKWVQLDNVNVDPVSGTVTGSVTHFTKFAVLATPKEEAKPGTGGTELSDMKGHWAEASIRGLIGAGAISGYPDGTFRPEKRITRAEFVSILVKALKLNTAGSGKVFADTANHWAQPVIAAAAAQGIVSGYSDAAFGPDDVITREQMAVMLVHALHVTKGAASVASFTDSAAISAWAQEAVMALTSRGLLNGYEDGTLRPQGETTRAEATTLIWRALQVK
ncbi:S-layer homology domain-containing protein [Paenibacillus ferrarius]|uniref:S-layer homology domain-containing protein n=1 Tax=Paenibacillus ferrarius TaxID=1469647 RepID=UPI003D2D55C6